MPNTIRAYIPGGTYFFTVNLLERRRRLLVENIEPLRSAFRTVKQQRPFQIEAIVILPDHLHCLWTLPPDDCDFSTVGVRLNRLFQRLLNPENGFQREGR
jgi:putative transposase